MARLIFLLLVGGLAYGSEQEATSLLGKPLMRPELADEVRLKMEDLLAKAEKEFLQNPSVETGIWLGRRIAYLGRYKEAIELYSKLIEQYPNDARLYRHRGHRYISIRKFQKAIADFEKAAVLIEGTRDETEPDGLPNKYNIPTSTTQSNIWYHLGLAYYLAGNFEKALSAYKACLKVSKNDDMLCATTHWLYMTLRRLGDQTQADAVLKPIHEDMKILENEDYHRLLLMYKGLLSPSALGKMGSGPLSTASLGYGLANWHFYNGQTEKAISNFKTILNGPSWSAFGYIAAEAELALLK